MSSFPQSVKNLVWLISKFATPPNSADEFQFACVTASDCTALNYYIACEKVLNANLIDHCKIFCVRELRAYFKFEVYFVSLSPERPITGSAPAY